ncbi:fluoride efflux transporter FluC [Alicyclobacillus dauci]|uniref:Fluoride-specific ion channel FluC n=1 Tax=Alicyclobacillus dauci TaxID=1475485 RepID=A0ABY6Z6I4_9BACL|nr:CrcB family protein [Alicyclobacillus dauci]WAH38513.1 CrcB family protein [Alicyclobacillus dauci]
MMGRLDKPIVASLAVFVGGCIGGTLRELCNVLLPSTHFPWGTFVVNLVGAFALGVLLELKTTARFLRPWLLTALTTGTIGAFTTFSTWILDILRLSQSSPSICFVAVVSSLALSLAANVTGRLIVRGHLLRRKPTEKASI